MKDNSSIFFSVILVVEFIVGCSSSSIFSLISTSSFQFYSFSSVGAQIGFMTDSALLFGFVYGLNTLVLIVLLRIYFSFDNLFNSFKLNLSIKLLEFFNKSFDIRVGVKVTLSISLPHNYSLIFSILNDFRISISIPLWSKPPTGFTFLLR